MCGIAGVFAGAEAVPPQLAELYDMAAMLSHRGPDGYGVYRDHAVGLAHTRLSLIDLAAGAQPMSNRDGSLWLSFNGEIFNYIELRDELLGLGHEFATESDTEVILQCYAAFGPAAWTKFNGQFAFALWDTRQAVLWLVRDRLGILPLHVATTGTEIAFASEAKAIFGGGRFRPELDTEALGQIFVNWSAVSPLTIFKGVFQVPPATAMRIDRELQMTSRRYWEPDPEPGAATFTSADAAADRLEEILDRSIALRLRADVPVGAYVSGGLDSSLVATMAHRKVDRMETFGIRFADARYDEGSEQRLVTDRLGTHHHEIVCDGAAIAAALGETVWHCETPMLRASPAPLYLLAGLVRTAGIRTVLTGEGADELMCGYSIFKEAQVRRFWARAPESQTRPRLLQRVHSYIGSASTRSSPLWQAFFRQGLLDTADPYYSHKLRWSNSAWTLRLLSPAIRQSVSLDGLTAKLDEQMPAGWQNWPALARAQQIEIASFMSSYLLACQGDRVAMAHGIEARYPFLDPDFVDFTWALPQRFKLLGLRDKLLLRRVARRCLPDEIAGRPKLPFRAPIGPEIFDLSAPWLDDLESGGGLDLGGVIDRSAARTLVGRAQGPGGQALSEREKMGLTAIMTLHQCVSAFGPGFADRLAAARRRLGNLTCHVRVDRVK